MAEHYGPKFDTMALHAGQRPDPMTGARAVPIYQTTSFVFGSSDAAAALFNLEQPGLPGAGHMTMLEAPVAVTAALREIP